METFPPEEQQLAMAMWGMGLMVRADPRSHRRRLDYRQLELALELLHQPADRRHRLRDGLRLRARPALSATSARRSGAVDYLGMVYLVLWLGLLQIVVDRGERADWFNSAWVIWAAIISGSRWSC